MAFSIVRLYILALGIAYVVVGQQLFPGEPACAEACYQSAITTNSCSPSDLMCQCSPSGRAVVSLMGGSCLLTNCTVNDISTFTTAYSAACAALPPAGTTNATATPPGPGVATAQTSPLQAQQSPAAAAVNTTNQEAGAPSASAAAAPQPQEQQRGAAGLSPAAITIVAVLGAAAGVLFGAAAYFFAVRRRRLRDQRQWAKMEQEKAAMQTSLDELRRTVSRRGTFDSAGSAEKAEGGGGGGGKPGGDAPALSRSSSGASSGAYGKRDTFVVNSKDGPQELMVPESTYYELPESVARVEKM